MQPRRLAGLCDSGIADGICPHPIVPNPVAHGHRRTWEVTDITQNWGPTNPTVINQLHNAVSQSCSEILSCAVLPGLPPLLGADSLPGERVVAALRNAGRPLAVVSALRR